MEHGDRLVFLLAALVLAVYWQAGGFPFVNYDDGMYVYENPQVRAGLTGRGIAWAFTTFHASNWHPLTWLSHMLDVEMFGLDAGWHHRVNVLFHALNAILLFLVLRGMTGEDWKSGFVAALFAVHPLHVESVAWVAERKDVLSTFFLFLSMGAYGHYVKRPGTLRYMGVAVPFALGLLCKPMLVSLPLVLLLLDYWPLARVWPPDAARGDIHPGRIPPLRIRWIVEKVPLAAMSLASCGITYLAQSRGGAVLSTELIPPGTRVSNALVSWAGYLGKAAWPASLAVFYPHPALTGAGIPAWKAWGAATLLGGITLLSLRWARVRPYLAVGWFWYLITLVPVIGILQTGSQSMADRYTYVPLIGPFLAIAWGVPDLLSRFRAGRRVAGTLAAVALCVLSVAAWNQVNHWKDNATLYGHALEATRENWMAHNNLANDLLQRGETGEAFRHYSEAVRIRPYHPYANASLGWIYMQRGWHGEAVAHYIKALQGDRNNAEAHYQLGLALSNAGDADGAIRHFSEALRLRPGDKVIRSVLDMALESKRK
jgi:hypothetical protein